MSQFIFYSLFQDIIQIHERYFPEIEVHYIHRFNLIFSLVRLPKGEMKKRKEKKLLLPSTPNQKTFIVLKGDHQSNFARFPFQ